MGVYILEQTSKKAYNAPRLNVYGSMKELTNGSKGQGPHDGWGKNHDYSDDPPGGTPTGS